MEKLFTALHHPEPTRAQLAIHILSEMMAEPRATLSLIDLLDTAGDAAVLRDTVVALGRFTDPRAVPAIASLRLHRATPLMVRTAAVDALGQIGGSGARAVLESALVDPNAAVREGARRVLSRERTRV